MKSQAVVVGVLVATMWVYGWFTWKRWPIYELRKKSLAWVLALAVLIAGFTAYFFSSAEWARMLCWFGVLLFFSPRQFDMMPRPWNRSPWSTCSVISRSIAVTVAAIALLARVAHDWWLLVVVGAAMAVALASQHMDKQRLAV